MNLFPAYMPGGPALSEMSFQLFPKFSQSLADTLNTLESRRADGTQPYQPGMDMATQVVPLCALYLLAVLVSSRLMATREAFGGPVLKRVLLVYNFSCVVLAAIPFIEMTRIQLHPKYGRFFACNALVNLGSKEDVDGHGSRMAFACWLFFAQKYWEWLDTIFFIMRKSWRQVSFLHVYHHATVPLLVGFTGAVDFNGDQYLAGILNSGVHVLMYSHYFVSALGFPTPWRKALTSLQLVQFVLNVTQHSYALYRGDDCAGSPYCVRVIMVVYFIIQFLLFAHFFSHAYRKKPRSKMSEKKA